MALRIWSDEFQEGGFLSTAHEADSHGGTGQNQSPALFWDGIPAGTKSLALTVYDPTRLRAAASGIGWSSICRPR